jgi:hypothetical protein
MGHTLSFWKLCDVGKELYAAINDLAMPTIMYGCMGTKLNDTGIKLHDISTTFMPQ